jgi:hypothetical protein
MTGVPLLVAAVGLGLLWTLGGLALRLGGALAFWTGLVGFLIGGGTVGALVAVLGALAWTAGQAHHALRHGAARGPLGRRVLDGLAGAAHRRDRG